MSFRWPLSALLVSVAAWVMPLVVGALSGGPASPGAPGWVVASYAVAGLALLVFIGLLVAWLAFRIGG